MTSRHEVPHRGTARVRIAGEDVEKIFREGGSAWLLDWMSALQNSARLSEIKSERNDVDGGPPTLVLVFTVPHGAEEENVNIRFIGATEREFAKTIAASAVDHVLHWLRDDAINEVDQEQDDDLVVIGDEPAASELNAVFEAMTKRHHRAIAKSFESAAALIENGQTRRILIDLATEEICGDERLVDRP